MAKQLVVYYVPEHEQHQPKTHAVVGRQDNVIGSDFGHAECASRLPTILATLKESYSDLNLILSTRKATHDELRLCHTQELIEFLEGAWERLLKQTTMKDVIEVVPGTFSNYVTLHSVVKPKGNVLWESGCFCFDTSTPVGEFTYKCALQAAAASVDAANQLELTPDNSHVIYALLRPPGHHASQKFYGGFCYFNNAAISAQILLNRLQASNNYAHPRVAIIDLDYHHGNGTQDIFYETDQIVYLSTHASPEWDYPFFSGLASETGSGKGEGYNFNYPMPPEATYEKHYLPAIFDIIEKLKTPRYESQVIVVSLGFDALQDDPIGSFNLLPENFGHFGELIASLNLPTLVVQEGGSTPDRSKLANSASL